MLLLQLRGPKPAGVARRATPAGITATCGEGVRYGALPAQKSHRNEKRKLRPKIGRAMKNGEFASPLTNWPERGLPSVSPTSLSRFSPRTYTDIPLPKA